jgi:hypothetical protein
MTFAAPSTRGAVRLSRSPIWDAQRQFYERAGPDVFISGVLPYHVTSNPAVADAYARLIGGWQQDLGDVGAGDDAAADPAAMTLTVLEIGPGPGRLTHQLLSALERLLPASGVRWDELTYVCADISPMLLDSIRQHPANRKWVQSSQLQFALFDADRPGAMTASSGSRLDLRATAGPLVIVANYVFDSLPQDAFYVSDGRVWQTLARLDSEPESVATADPIARLPIAFEQHPAERRYYGDDDLDDLLARFTDGYTGSLLFPVGALRFLRELTRVARDRPLLLLVADKACTPGAPETQVPHLEFHGDHCFSMAVNLDVLDASWQRTGRVLKRTDHAELLAFRVFASGGSRHRHLDAAFGECIERRAPDDWFLWSLRIGREVHTYSLAEMMAVLRLSSYDPAVLNDCFTMMFRRLTTATAPERAQLRQIVHRVMSNYYYLGENPDVAFEAGSLLYAIGAYDEALERLSQSETLSGPRPATLYQQARCLYQLGDKRTALARVRTARATGEDFEQFLLLAGIVDQPRAREFEQRLAWEISIGDIGPT